VHAKQEMRCFEMKKAGQSKCQHEKLRRGRLPHFLAMSKNCQWQHCRHQQQLSHLCKRDWKQQNTVDNSTTIVNNVVFARSSASKNSTSKLTHLLFQSMTACSIMQRKTFMSSNHNFNKDQPPQAQACYFPTMLAEQVFQTCLLKLCPKDSRAFYPDLVTTTCDMPIWFQKFILILIRDGDWAVWDTLVWWKWASRSCKRPSGEVLPHCLLISTWAPWPGRCLHCLCLLGLLGKFPFWWLSLALPAQHCSAIAHCGTFSQIVDPNCWLPSLVLHSITMTFRK